MRKLAFEVNRDGQTVEFTATTLKATGGAVRPNVDRWRGQVGLPPADDSEAVEEIELDGMRAAYVHLIGPAVRQPQKSILGVIAVRGDTAWFFKFMGDADLVAAEKAKV